MEVNKLSQPVAVCTLCGECSIYLHAIDERCFKQYKGRRCQGVFGSALAPGDWQECPRCAATGRADNERCYQCKEWGWEFVRGKLG
jgi:hypothetical protein